MHAFGRAPPRLSVSVFVVSGVVLNCVEEAQVHRSLMRTYSSALAKYLRIAGPTDQLDRMFMWSCGLLVSSIG